MARALYTQIRDGLPRGMAIPGTALGRQRWSRAVSLNVLLLGLTSLFTDISSEMVSTVLPLYLVYYLRFTPFEFGILDGLYQGIAALVRVGGGLAADRWGRHKEVAAFGYGLSAICKLGLVVAGTAWTGLASLILLDRVGKGVRTAPRDALISLSTPPAHLGTAFGVHRALDTVGAFLGPLAAFGLLTLVADGFSAIFIVSLCAALIGFGILFLFVENRTVTKSVERTGTASLSDVLGLLRGRPFRLLVMGGAALGLATISDGFLYLGLQRRVGFAEGLFPLLFVVTSLVYFILAVPMGRLADRIGRRYVFLSGYALLPLAYLILLLPTVTSLETLVCLLLVGAYYAATDGVLMALASVLLPPRVRSSGLGLLTTAVSVGQLLASVMFGALWSAWGMDTAVGIFGLGLIAAIVIASVGLLSQDGADSHERTTVV